MGQKAEINGTGYDIKAGKCLVGGTAYAIKKGRTLKDGTGYDVKLKTGETWLLSALVDPNAWGSVWRTFDLTPYMDSFESNGQVFLPYISLNSYGNGEAGIQYGGYYTPIGVTGNPTSVYEGTAWANQGYRTVTFPRTLEGTPLYEYFSKMGMII